jgi:diguanylate cyclase (GGDEF)-like protein/PAS domain S-box-containing protein
VREGTDGQPTGMNMAIAGKEGDLIGQDYRGHIVVSVYRPLAPGMGLGVKRDVEDLFQPIREQVKWGLALVLSIVGAGTLLLRSLVRPIATRLWESEAEAKKRELRARATLDNLAEGVVTLDEHGVIESFGGGAPALFGYAPEEVIGQSVKMLLPPKMRLRYSAHIQDYLRQSIGKRNAELLALRKDGTVFVMEFALNDLWLDGQRFFAVVVRDITERHQAEKALFEEKETLHVTLNSIGDGVITTDTAGCVTYLNPVAEHMTGWSNAEAVGQPFLEVFHIIHEATDEPTLNPVEVVLRSNESAGLAEHTVLVSRSGKRIAIEDSAAPIHDRSGKVIGVVLAFHDVSEARKVAAKMTHQAAHDALTGLVNRREFERRLQRVLDSGQHADNTLLYLDLDRFKIVNDTCGHQAGDELLRKLSELLQTAVRGNDTLARLGGDEFAVLLENCPAEPALRIAERILQIVNNFRFGWQEKAFQIGVSIGMVTFSGDGLTMADILSMVDAACYVAKDTGRNRIQVYTPDDKVLAQRHGETTWLQRIRQALDEDRFVLHAQPIMSLRAGPDDEEHVELLLRMVEDDKLIPPTAFIPAAERYGLMPEIDRWVIRSAFANYVQRGAEDGAPGMYAINLSGASVSDEHFLAFVLEQFQHHAVPPQKICFEITETAAIANLKLATQLIQGLKAIGCRFALDDFGSGMSSFGYLKHLPVDCLKIDGSFVKAMVSDPIDYAMVTSINQIGHVMGMQTIAEFVEDDAILDALRNIGVDFAQGFGIAKPAPLNTVWLKAAA